MKKITFIIFLFTLTSCGKKITQWTFDKQISLEKDKIGAIGIVKQGDHFWIADSDNNRVVKTDQNGTILEEVGDLERPMHIDLADHKVFISEYSADTIRVLQNGKLSSLPLIDSLDAPAGVAVSGDRIAIADFYNHRVVYQVGKERKTFGSKGKGKGEFHYPTDLQFVGDLLYVADAYNNRIQVFDLDGKYIHTVGETDGMNAATGIYVTGNQLIVTDFENSRLLIYNTADNSLEQIIEDDHLDKPTDAFVEGTTMYVTNYKGKNIGVYHLKKVDAKATNKQGKEYTAAYICPMYCKGSGSDQPGTCPVCKMDYVVNE